MGAVGNFRECTTCHEWGWFDTTVAPHQCRPAWDCRAEDGDDSYWRKIHAGSSEIAAEKFAQEYDYEGAEYSICSGEDEPIVLVRQAGSETVERWRVSGEMVPNYRAEKADA